MTIDGFNRDRYCLGMATRTRAFVVSSRSSYLWTNQIILDNSSQEISRSNFFGPDSFATSKIFMIFDPKKIQNIYDIHILYSLFRTIIYLVPKIIRTNSCVLVYQILKRFMHFLVSQNNSLFHINIPFNCPF